MADLAQVKVFWDTHPLFTGECDPNDEHFFKEHDAVYTQDVLRHTSIATVFGFPDRDTLYSV